MATQMIRNTIAEKSSRPLRTHKESSMTSCLEFLTRWSILAPRLAHITPMG